MGEAEKAMSISDFEHSVYPIWMGIEKKDFENERAMTNAQVDAQNTLLECLTLHRQDLAIFQSGIKPNRMTSTQERMGDLRRKAARAAGV